MSFNGTSVGLDVHALSVVAHAVDEQTGRVERARLCPDQGEILDWLRRLRGPVRVAYEAGPTGFGLARALADAQIDCVVAAPSKLIRPAGDRVKTDGRDAAHLTRLLRLGEITAVTVPEADVEAVRDLVRAREAARAAGCEECGIGLSVRRCSPRSGVSQSSARWPAGIAASRTTMQPAQRGEKECGDRASRTTMQPRSPGARVGTVF